MKIIAKAGREDIATVYIAEVERENLIEFVESVQPPIPRDEKWVLIVSTLHGCPVRCRFCDAGGFYKGKISKRVILLQINYLVKKRYPDRKVRVKKFKIQFARMGEPSFNDAVLEVINSLPEIYEAPGLIPCISTVAPRGVDDFFENLLEIKKIKYARRFQLQFSIHTTDEKLRNWIIPLNKWDFSTISLYGERFYDKDGRKITLNFALADGIPLDPDVLLKYFNPEIFLVKITPVNPTYTAVKNLLFSKKVFKNCDELINSLRQCGYDVILSIGELEENKIGSNCGQYLLRHMIEKEKLENAYSYGLIEP